MPRPSRFETRQCARTHKQTRGLTSLAFALLDPGRPSGCHICIRCITANYSRYIIILSEYVAVHEILAAAKYSPYSITLSEYFAANEILIKRLSTGYFSSANGREGYVARHLPRLSFAGRRFYSRRTFSVGNVSVCSRFLATLSTFRSLAFIAMLRLSSYFYMNCV